MSAAGTLLRILGSVVSPGVRPERAERSQAGATEFADLLQRADKGEIASGRGVTVARKAGVNLTPGQLDRIAAAADRAEAQGATRALVFIDGMVVRLDITMREVTGQVDLSAGGMLTDIDAVVGVPPEKDAPGQGGDAAPGPLPLPGAGGIGHPSLLKALSGRSGASGAD